MTMKSLPRKIVLALTLGVFAACVAPGITDPTRRGDAAARANMFEQGISGFGSKLIKCDTEESATSTALVTPLGGLVSVGGTSVLIPAGALLSDATVTISVPASKYMRVDVSVEGFDHFVFEQPVTVTVDYSRCTDPNLNLTPLTAWYVDFGTKRLLEAMPSVDNKLTKTVTFTTGHLSGYALADRTDTEDPPLPGT
jgi:hypothetical protein